jgi:integrase
MSFLKLIPPQPGRSRFYRLRGTDPTTGKRVDASTGVEEYRKAKLVHEKAERNLLNGVLGRASRTFTEAAIEYIEARQPTGSQRASIIGTIRKTDGQISPCLVCDLGDTDCRKIVQAMVNEIVRKRYTRTRHGKPYKPGTIVRELIQPLTCVLNYAHDQGWCDKPHFVRPRFNDKRSEYATADQANRLLRAASPTNRRWYLFSMMEGTRVSETLDLDWADVQLDRSWAIIRDTKNNDEDRGIALHRQIIEMLSVVPEAERVGKVFKSAHGEAYAEAEGGGRGKTGWNATKRRAGIRSLHLHDLRHTFATMALMSGMQPRLQREQMGHEADGMYGRYAHVPRDELVNAVAALPRLDYEDISYREWVRSGFGRYVSETDDETENKVPAATEAA